MRSEKYLRGGLGAVAGGQVQVVDLVDADQTGVRVQADAADCLGDVGDVQAAGGRHLARVSLRGAERDLGVAW